MRPTGGSDDTVHLNTYVIGVKPVWGLKSTDILTLWFNVCLEGSRQLQVLSTKNGEHLMHALVGSVDRFCS